MKERQIALQLAKQYLRVCRLAQRGKPKRYCGHPTCRREWHDTLSDIRLCRRHHPRGDCDPRVYERPSIDFFGLMLATVAIMVYGPYIWLREKLSRTEVEG